MMVKDAAEVLRNIEPDMDKETFYEWIANGVIWADDDREPEGPIELREIYANSMGLALLLRHMMREELLTWKACRQVAASIGWRQHSSGSLKMTDERMEAYLDWARKQLGYYISAVVRVVGEDER